MDETETVQEKTSLADRFGIRIPFLSLDRGDYLDMAETLARQAGADLAWDALRKAALRWEMEHGARTPRVACQFAEYISTIRAETESESDGGRL